MTKFYINSAMLDKLIHQNKADCIECIEGCLQDNYLFTCKNGFMAIYENALNCWTSNFLVMFSRDNKEIETIMQDFYKKFNVI